MVAIFDLPLTQMSESVHTSPTELLDPENVGVAFGISLISCMLVEILHCFISTSGFWRPSLIFDSLRYCTVFISIALCSLIKKCRFDILGFPLVSCTEAETKVVHACFRFMAAILISS